MTRYDLKNNIIILQNLLFLAEKLQKGISFKTRIAKSNLFNTRRVGRQINEKTRGNISGIQGRRPL